MSNKQKLAQSAFFSDIIARTVIPATVYVGWYGDIILCQEWTTPAEERYLRIKVPVGDAKALANEILRLAEGAQ